MKHWIDSDDVDGEADVPSESFFNDIEAVCRRHGLSIGHQDGYGAFIIEMFDESNIEWLRGAHFSNDAYRHLIKG